MLNLNASVVQSNEPQHNLTAGGQGIKAVSTDPFNQATPLAHTNIGRFEAFKNNCLACMRHVSPLSLLNTIMPASTSEAQAAAPKLSTYRPPESLGNTALPLLVRQHEPDNFNHPSVKIIAAHGTLEGKNQKSIGKHQIFRGFESKIKARYAALQGANVEAVSLKSLTQQPILKRLDRLNPLKSENHGAQRIVQEVLKYSQQQPKDEQLYLPRVHLEGLSKGCAVVMKAVKDLQTNHGIEVGSVDLNYPVLSARQAVRNLTNSRLLSLLIPQKTWDLEKITSQGASAQLKNTQVRVLNSTNDAFANAKNQLTINNLLNKSFDNVELFATNSYHSQSYLPRRQDLKPANQPPLPEEFHSFTDTNSMQFDNLLFKLNNTSEFDNALFAIEPTLYSEPNYMQFESSLLSDIADSSKIVNYNYPQG